MDLTIRDWMVIVGTLLIVAVILDVWRRLHEQRRSGVRVQLAGDKPEQGDPVDDITWLKELPNGGARVVDRGDLLRARVGQRERERQPGGEAPGQHRGAGADAADEPELVQGLSGSDDEGPDTLDWLDGMGATGSDDTAAGESDGGRLPREPDPEVFMLNVVARSSEGFRGEDILHILLACDLRLGDMNFFHRHEFEAGRGAIQFSVANMMQPGVFDIDSMAELNTPGLVFFLTLPGPEDMMKAYDYMLETAQAVARNLGGDVLDESRSVLTRQATEHSRQQIRELEQRLLTRTR